MLRKKKDRSTSNYIDIFSIGVCDIELICVSRSQIAENNVHVQTIRDAQFKDTGTDHLIMFDLRNTIVFFSLSWNQLFLFFTNISSVLYSYDLRGDNKAELLWAKPILYGGGGGAAVFSAHFILFQIFEYFALFFGDC